MRAVDATIALMPDQGRETVRGPKPRRTPKPTALVIGGTGFLGRALTRALVAQGHDVRVLSRGAYGPFDDLPETVETCAVSLRDEAGLTRAMQGIEVVYNLARALGTSWEDCLENDIGVSDRIARAALAAGVGRFVYTGTIASYDMSNTGAVITESTPFAPDMSDRNLYARSKAECERRLWDMQREHGLPLTIARPGIVVGHGGPLQHWGIGRWHGAGAVRIWGHGRNTLPFVLIDDVTDALIRMMDQAEIEGQGYNIVGEPMMSARDYFQAIHDQMDARLNVSTSSLYALFVAVAVKHALKVSLLRRKGLSRASLKDWKSRAHFTPFDNTKPKVELGWTPETDRAKVIAAAITDANLFGF